MFFDAFVADKLTLNIFYEMYIGNKITFDQNDESLAAH